MLLAMLFGMLLHSTITTTLFPDTVLTDPLHAGAFTHNFFYSKTVFHTGVLTHRSFDTYTVARRSFYTHFRKGYSSTHTLLHTGAFKHKRFCTQAILHTHRRFYTQTLLHTETLTFIHIRTQKLLTQVWHKTIGILPQC
jgi:hypothetical protein